MTTYTAKSSAVRAAKREMEKNSAIIGYSVAQLEDGKWVADLQMAPLGDVIMGQRFSTVERPCDLVHGIARKMADSSRKEVIAACVAAGVAYNTARTQYQRWYSNQKIMKLK